MLTRTSRRVATHGHDSAVYFLNLLTTPVIYSLAVPLLVLDTWVTLYQQVCFRMYGIARVTRRPYFVMDRHRLRYLGARERLACFYCSYATGLLAYTREIAARTEQYWCPIRHARRLTAPHGRYRRFVKYGDASGYRHGLVRFRRELGGHPHGTQEIRHDRPHYTDSRPRRLQPAR